MSAGTLPESLLARLDADQEIDVITHRADGSARKAVPIWVVRAGDAAYVRSWRGPGGGWYRHASAAGRMTIRVGGTDHAVAVAPVPAADAAQGAIDAAYRAKYGRYGGSYLDPMLAPQAVATTLELTTLELTTPELTTPEPAQP